MSSYNSPLPVGSDQATGAYAIAVGNNVGVDTNNGNRTDSAGNVAPDFVWGNFPMQPNDERAAAVTPANFSANSSGDYAWGATTRVAADRLDPALSNHAVAEAEWANYPSFYPAAGKYMVTAATGNGTTVTYTAQNNLQAGDVVNITGLTASAYNLSSATVASANALSFTVTNSANAGEITGQWYGKVESTTAASAADGAGIAYIVVPSVLGDTTAVALDKLKDAGYETANITTASAATNTLTDITRFNATSATVAVIYATNAHTNYLTGTKVTVVAGTPAGADPVNLPAYALGTWTVTGTAGSGQITVSGSGFTVADTTGVNATDTLAGAAGTIKTQSTAANASSVATTATITVTPYATATA
jgi:hypothetical protein